MHPRISPLYIPGTSGSLRHRNGTDLGCFARKQTGTNTKSAACFCKRNLISSRPHRMKCSSRFARFSHRRTVSRVRSRTGRAHLEGKRPISLSGHARPIFTGFSSGGRAARLQRYRLHVTAPDGDFLEPAQTSASHQSRQRPSHPACPRRNPNIDTRCVF